MDHRNLDTFNKYQIKENKVNDWEAWSIDHRKTYGRKNYKYICHNNKYERIKVIY